MWDHPALSGCKVFLLGTSGTRDGLDPGKGIGSKAGFFPYL